MVEEVTKTLEEGKKYPGEIVEVESGGYKLKGNLVVAPNSTKPVVLIGHGAAKNDNPVKYLNRLQITLAERGYTSMVVHNRGVGDGEYKSGGSYESTILERVVDFENASDFLLNQGNSDKLILIACSLNGETAALATPKFGDKLKAIVLLEPAAYAPGVENIPLGTDQFTFALRRTDLAEEEKETRILSSPAFMQLQKFKGSLFVAYGEKDVRVPKFVQEKYRQVAEEKGRRGRVFELPQESHTLTAHPNFFLYDKVSKFLEDSISSEVKINRPRMIFLRGLPGTGKTTLALEIQKRSPEAVVVLDPDLIDYESENYTAFLKSIPEGSEKFAPYRFLLNKASKALQEGKEVIWVQAWTKIRGMELAASSLRKIDKEIDIKIVELEVPEEEIKKRLEKRKSSGGHTLDRRPLEEFMSSYERITDQLPFKADFATLDASKGTEELANAILDQKLV